MANPRNETLRDHFLGWQCRIRQIAMRKNHGRPSAGMRPRVLTRDGRELSVAMTVLLVPSAPEESTSFFRFQVQKTRDPKQTYEKGLEYLQSSHFQHPKNFSDELTALFNTGSPLAEALLAMGGCVLEFDQFSQRYRLPCGVRQLASGDPAFEATYWHNLIFNPAIPGEVTILGLRPDWASAQAEPAL
jgi:hypothetical protein